MLLIVAVLDNNPPQRANANPAINKQTPKPVAAKTVNTESPPAQTATETATPVVAAPVPSQPENAPSPVVSQVTGTNDAMQYVFSHESSNNPYAINAASGACGLGQALPCSKLLNACGSLDNIDCQMEWFSTYAVDRYGSWQGAMAYWIGHGWW